MSDAFFDVLVIGAGPTGLACAIDAQNAGFSVVIVDKGCLCNSLFHYPAHMTFFTTPELLEIGNMPFSSPNQKPTRSEALEYYRKVSEHYKLNVLQYRTVEGGDRRGWRLPRGHDGPFRARGDAAGAQADRRDGLLRPAQLSWDSGEDLPKVAHYYHEPHPYFGLNVLVIGGKNSSAIAALDLWRHGAKVTLVHRGEAMHRHVKYWILPDINNRIKNGEVTAYFGSTVEQITEDTVTIATPAGKITMANDQVFALTGYHPDFGFLERLGVHLEEDNDRCPVCDAASLESNVPGIYLAGVIVAGRADQRNLHREWALSWQADRRLAAREDGGGGVRLICPWGLN